MRLQKTGASKWIGSLRMGCIMICWKRPECISKGICGAHHHVFLLLWPWVDRLVWAEGIGWLLRHCSHLNHGRGDVV
uniref:Clathrin assembly protein n=1 Tax=Rhizophora mucronata TaxID=61149 RepID=A0A2P2PKZ4_RHIMU